ncbi:iron-containing alcohol dehydrogenase [Fodinicola acaciae]|uniref:iron-containing alcohol dehydrogenase n=1 Tax=Fodinicola acaciae TaxID=2681555 RepID=UPI001FEA13E0|nr:iron-containing alcohol dehydrogenase [Fodinicola acaciae]
MATQHQQVCKFLVPELVFGEGALAEAGYAARRLGARRAFVVTDDGVVEAGWPDLLAGYLRDVDLPFSRWSGLTPNPKDHEIAAGFEAYQASGCDVIIGLGGGSVIDAAKAIAVLSTNGGRILDYVGLDRVTRPIPPLLTIPTTAGTGSDVSQFCVITDTALNRKAVLVGRALVPDISITDPALLTTMPPWLAAATGLDALTHGIEAYVSRAASRLTDPHALQAVRLTGDNLERMVNSQTDEESRAAMAQASLSAGLAFTNAILGATHAMSHQVGGALDLPHGVVNAILLPHVIRFNATSDRYRPVAEALGIDTLGMDTDEIAYAVADDVRAMADRLDIPRGLGDLGVSEADLPGLARGTLDDVCLSTNPRDASLGDVTAIFAAAL